MLFLLTVVDLCSDIPEGLLFNLIISANYKQSVVCLYIDIESITVALLDLAPRQVQALSCAWLTIHKQCDLQGIYLVNTNALMSASADARNIQQSATPQHVSQLLPNMHSFCVRVCVSGSDVRVYFRFRFVNRVSYTCSNCRCCPPKNTRVAHSLLHKKGKTGNRSKPVRGAVAGHQWLACPWCYLLYLLLFLAPGSCCCCCQHLTIFGWR